MSKISYEESPKPKQREREDIWIPIEMPMFSSSVLINQIKILNNVYEG